MAATSQCPATTLATSLKFSSLTSVGGTITCFLQRSMDRISFGALASVQSITLQKSEKLKTLDLGALTSVPGDLVLDDVFALASLAFLAMLTSVGGTLELNSLTGLTSVDMGSIERVGDLVVEYVNKLEIIDLGNATSGLVEPDSVTIASNNRLTAIDFGQIATSGSPSTTKSHSSASVSLPPLELP